MALKLLNIVSGLRPAHQAEPARAGWRALFPHHRLAAVAKTPLLIALGAYLTRSSSPRLWGAMALCALMWTALYALNEATDLRLEEGVAPPRSSVPVLLAISVLICAGAIQLSPMLALLFLCMAAGQCAYCLPPLRLKRWYGGVLLLSGVMNVALRMLCGTVWGTQPLSWLPVSVMICLHLSAAIRTRTLVRDKDRKRGYVPAPPGLEAAGMALNALAALGCYAYCFLGYLPPAFFGVITLGTAYSVYAWSGRAPTTERLRRGWALLAVASTVIVPTLLRSR